MNSRILRYIYVALVIAALTLGCANNGNGTGDSGGDNGAASQDDQELIAVGETVYQQNCAGCHGDEGEGTEGGAPALAGNDFVAGEPAPVIEVVANGSGAMPAFGDRLDDEQIAAVISHIRTAWGNDASVVTPADVGEVQ